MPRVHVLPGERVEATLRPSVLLYMPDLLRAALVAVWGVLLWALTSAPSWQRHVPGPSWQFWTYFWGTAGALYAYTMLGIALLGLATGAAMRRPWWHGLLGGAGIGATAVAMAAIWMPEDPAALAASCAVLALVLAAALEAERRGRAVVFTNIRLVVEQGRRWGGQTFVHYEDVTDIDTIQSPLTRGLDYGHLVPVLAARAGGGELVVRGVRPLSQAQELLAAMVQHATASPELKRAGDTESRLYRALRALGVRPSSAQ